jgi:hypothetical protein
MAVYAWKIREDFEKIVVKIERYLWIDFPGISPKFLNRQPN